MDKKALLMNFLVTFVAAFLAISLFAALHQPPRFRGHNPEGFPPPPPPYAHQGPNHFSGPAGPIRPGQPGPTEQVGGPQRPGNGPGMEPGAPGPNGRGPRGPIGPRGHEFNPNAIPPQK